MFAGARSFDGSIQRQQVRLLSKIVDDFNNLANVVSARAERSNNVRGILNRPVYAIETIGGFLHGLNAALDLFTRTLRDIEQDLCRIGNTLDRGDHLVDRS